MSRAENSRLNVPLESTCLRLFSWKIDFKSLWMFCTLWCIWGPLSMVVMPDGLLSLWTRFALPSWLLLLPACLKPLLKVSEGPSSFQPMTTVLLVYRISVYIKKNNFLNFHIWLKWTQSHLLGMTSTSLISTFNWCGHFTQSPLLLQSHNANNTLIVYRIQ